MARRFVRGHCYHRSLSRHPDPVVNPKRTSKMEGIKGGSQTAIVVEYVLHDDRVGPSVHLASTVPPSACLRRKVMNAGEIANYASWLKSRISENAPALPTREKLWELMARRVSPGPIRGIEFGVAFGTGATGGSTDCPGQICDGTDSIDSRDSQGRGEIEPGCVRCRWKNARH